VQLGHGASLVWAVLWVFAGLRAGEAPWGGIVAGTGAVVTLLVLVARVPSARAWLLLELVTVILLVCCVASLFADSDGAAGAAVVAPDDVPEGVQVTGEVVGRPAGGVVAEENALFVGVTVLCQAVAVVALNRRSSRVWHGVDPTGWRTILDR
jgi:hypothetical protein